LIDIARQCKGAADGFVVAVSAAIVPLAPAESD
jgi:hypothetical protein